MADIMFCCERRLSGFDVLQEEKIYRYTLQRAQEPEAGFCVSIQSWKGDTRQNDDHAYFDAREEKAKALVLWLCENTVAPAHLADVLQDLKYDGYIAMQG